MMAAATNDDKGKARALDIAVSQLEKQFGRGTLVRLGDDSFRKEYRLFRRAVFLLI